ncbi:Hemolysins and related protein containing CBS domains [Methanosarcina horonobensis HB-1 = JCM 15518]|uniref:Hemolysins and related protein containing CBS domains n=1 Tax=Methanosarcina horonobensis HB-1 = JCM 15518 TaxID=1434110 RepID=A0A0E3SCE7_9EURY|nr:hemolysin family protein [Methanosarcina horonobensis]AKB78531.1 Hemolysins and related protein containing CBS domains [Methanosarcina horonobensis HB-1 = JCM 15518]
MPSFFEVMVILILIVLNGIFSLSEFALVSAKKTRLRQRAEEGDKRAATALKLANEPTPFLSTIQIGITMVGIFAGAFGGATMAGGLATYLREFPALAPYSDTISITLVVLAITYLTLVFGELVPKRLALNNAEAIASHIAKPMFFLSLIAKPLVLILSHSTETVLRLMRVRKMTGPPVTEEEIKIMLEEGTKAGVFERAELSMIEGVFDIGDRRVESLMTHRTDIIALDLDEPVDENLRKMIESGRSNFPVYERDMNDVVGMVSVKDILAKLVESGTVDIRASITKPLFAPEAMTILKLLESFKETGVHIALITDEYGSIQGIITLHDILEAIVGDVHSLGEPVEAQVVSLEDGSWLIDGDTPIDKLKDALSVDSFPGEEQGYYRTIAGLIMFILQRIPKTGDHIELRGLRYEVVDMDGNRIDKVMVKQITEAPIK